MEQGEAVSTFVGLSPLLAFVAVTLAAGTAGGYANFLLARNSKLVADGGTDGLPWWGYCFVGVVAAFTVPLFLNLTQSNLLKDWLDHPGTSAGLVNLAVYGGFCLVAAFSSRAFMQGMADRVLAQLRREVEDAKKEVAEVKEEAKREVKEEARREVEDAASSTAEAVGEILAAPTHERTEGQASPPVSILGLQILKALLDGEKTAAAVGQRVGKRGLGIFLQLNNVLKPQGLVVSRHNGEDEPLLFSLTEEGRRYCQEHGDAQ